MRAHHLFRDLLLTALVILLAAPAAAEMPSRPMIDSSLDPRIVNGVTTTGFPSVVDILLISGPVDDPAFQVTVCSGTLIGCETVLSAAHCFCSGSTAASCGTPDPSSFAIFSQHFGRSGVASISIDPSYAFGSGGDAAVLKLTQPVSGIAPTPINTVGQPGSGSGGQIAGFGLTDGNLDDTGIKRVGVVSTAPCVDVPGSTHVCWSFDAPIGNPGTDSNTCSGDSGGPLFVDFGAGNVVAGITSGGINQLCRDPDDSFDTDVFVHRNWIQNAGGSDLNNTSCGGLPSAGEPGADIFFGEGTINASNPQQRFTLPVPEGTGLLRITQNGVDGFTNDFDLYVKAGSPPMKPSDFDCRPFLFGNFEVCEFVAPQPGTWHILVDRFDGEGDFQVTATLFEDTGACIPDATHICLLDRFRVSLEWEDFQNVTRDALRVGFGTSDSGLFYFLDPNNWELLVKMVDACSSEFNSFWVFAAATTNVGYTLTVEDTQSSEVKTYSNPLGVSAPAVTDTAAFATCP